MRPLGAGSVRSRLGYVLKQAVEQRGDNGRWQPAWSNTAGDVGSALISTTYYPHQSTNWGKLTGQNFGPPTGASRADRAKAIAAWELWWRKQTRE